jgi:4-hydroxy-3-polyprenylbenzoate decarboxylase
MGYATLEACLLDLEKNGQLLRIKEEVDPYLEMASIHLRIHEQGGPAILFENVKGSKFRAASNLFGTLERSKFIFRDTLEAAQQVIALKQDPSKIFKHPLKNLSAAKAALHALPFKSSLFKHNLDASLRIDQLPLIHHWPKDGGAFVTLPQVYTEDVDQPGIMQSNLGMYRIQLNGNDYKSNEEIGLHYQLHRGIGIHQTKALLKKEALKVSCFVGGPPAHTLAAVMPLPEGMSELTFAGLMGGRRFRYFYEDGYAISADADFVITGSVHDQATKPEGPFGDHLGYYSLQHNFPLMHVHKVYAKKNAIWPFTVVGRPPQEDTSFGALIHEITGDAIQHEIPGVQEVHAVDAAGVHPLLVAIGSERYTPYDPAQQPAELLTQANRILGTGQLSLAKFLFITASENKSVDTKNLVAYFSYIFERIDWKRDLHFHTNTSMDTLDYSGEGLNQGSKVVFAAYGPVLRKLATAIPEHATHLRTFYNPQIAIPGVLVFETNAFSTYDKAQEEMQALEAQLSTIELSQIAMIIIADQSEFVAANLNNFVWSAFTKCNPSHDMYGIQAFTHNKHWGCKGPLIMDARTKPHHAPALEKEPSVEQSVSVLLSKYGY